MRPDYSPHSKRLAAELREQALANIERLRSEADDLSTHRTRSNRRPNEPLHAPAALVVAVDAVYEALEDRQ